MVFICCYGVLETTNACLNSCVFVTVTASPSCITAHYICPQTSANTHFTQVKNVMTLSFVTGPWNDVQTEKDVN